MLFLNFLCVLALIQEQLGLGWFENQPRLKNFNLNLIFTGNIYIFNSNSVLLNS